MLMQNELDDIVDEHYGEAIEVPISDRQLI
jgi:hypothetical protein